MRSEPLRHGTLWGISYEVWPSVTTCYKWVGPEYVKRQYIGYGVRDAVRAFSAEVLRKGVSQ